MAVSWFDLIPALQGVQGSLDSLDSALSSLTASLDSTFGAFGDTFSVASENITAQLEHLADILVDISGKPAAAPTLTATADHVPTATAAGGPVAATDEFGSVLKGATGALATFGTLAALAGNRMGVFTAPINLAGAALEGLGKLGGVAGPALGAVGAAAQQAAQVFERVIGVMAQFAEVAAPGVMYEFNRALKDLQATVGTAFVPFFQAMIQITRQVAGELFPAMQALRPVFSALANVVGAVVVPVAKAFGEILTALMPFFTSLTVVLRSVIAVAGALLAPVVSLLKVVASLGSIWETLLAPLARLVAVAARLWEAFNPVVLILKGLATVLGGVAQIFAAVLDVFDPFIRVLEEVADDVDAVFAAVGAIFEAVIATLVEFIKALLPTFDLKNVMTALRDVTLQVIKALALFAVQVAKIFGLDIRANLIKAFEGLQQNKPFAVAAPENVRTANLESIAKDLDVAAARAVGVGGPGAEKKFDFKDIVEALKNGQDAQSGWTDDIKALVRETVTDAADKIVKKLNETLKVSLEKVTSEIRNIYEQTTDSIPGAKSAKDAGTAIGLGLRRLWEGGAR